VHLRYQDDLPAHLFTITQRLMLKAAAQGNHGAQINQFGFLPDHRRPRTLGVHNESLLRHPKLLLLTRSAGPDLRTRSGRRRTIALDVVSLLQD
jgi:hypothetical protein